MAFPVIADGLVVQVGCAHITDLGPSMINIIHYYPEGPLDPSLQVDMQADFAEFYTPWAVDIVPVLPVAMTFRRALITAWRSIQWGATPNKYILGLLYGRNEPVLFPGQRNFLFDGDQMPPFCSVGIQKHCINQNRNTRGSMRLGMLYEEDSNDGVLDPTIKAQYQTALDNFLANDVVVTATDGVTLITFKPVVYSFTKGFVANTVKFNDEREAASPWVDATINDDVTSQVTRKFGRGI